MGIGSGGDVAGDAGLPVAPVDVDPFGGPPGHVGTVVADGGLPDPRESDGIVAYESERSGGNLAEVKAADSDAGSAPRDGRS